MSDYASYQTLLSTGRLSELMAAIVADDRASGAFEANGQTVDVEAVRVGSTVLMHVVTPDGPVAYASITVRALRSETHALAFMSMFRFVTDLDGTKMAEISAPETTTDFMVI